MNDFTQEELLILHLGVMTEIEKHKGILKPSPFMLELRDKIESMIENYCKHEESEADHNYEVDKCKKCSKLFIK